MTEIKVSGLRNLYAVPHQPTDNHSSHHSASGHENSREGNRSALTQRDRKTTETQVTITVDIWNGVEKVGDHADKNTETDYRPRGPENG